MAGQRDNLGSGTTMHGGHEDGTDDSSNGEEHPAFTVRWSFGRR